MVRVVGRGSREQVVVLDAVMMSKMWEESTGEKAVKEGKGGWSGRGGDRNGGGGGVTNGGSQGAVDLGDFMVKGEEERVTEVR